jgi:hypothetical protein
MGCTATIMAVLVQTAVLTLLCVLFCPVGGKDHPFPAQEVHL